jgi:hypothetical protein
MKKYILLFGQFFIVFASLIAKQIDSTTAKLVGTNFIDDRIKSNNFNSDKTLKLIYTASNNSLVSDSTKNYFYIFNINSDGFVIVSGDDIVSPILGYSTNGVFNEEQIPKNTSKWLEGYINQIRFSIANHLVANDEIKSEWEELMYRKTSNNLERRAGSVSPLIQTQWGQSPNYNELCPYDNQKSDRSVTGCVATAMAQIMKYWEYPNNGEGFHSYAHPKYGTLSANFGSTTYKWGSMPNKITSSNNEIATLMYQCGVSVDMQYGTVNPGPGSASSGATDVAPALINYFSYSKNITVEEKSKYSTTDWLNILKKELDSKRPLYYEGMGGDAGHAFICDGYDINDLFHFNWGWDGKVDGYFKIGALNPGSYKFNDLQRVVKGIEPSKSTTSYKLALYSNITASANPVYYGSTFTISTNIANYGKGEFNGDYSAAIFDINYNFIDFVEIKLSNNLPSQYATDNLSFSTTGIFGMLPGTYFIGIFYKPVGGNWEIVADNSNYINLQQLTVINPSDIELNSSLSVSPSTTLTKGKSASVNFNIINDGNSTFYGQFQANLYTLEGKFVQTINTYKEQNGLPSGYTYLTPYISLSTNSITAEPGTYLLAIINNITGSNDWTLTGSSYYQNPIMIIVQQPDILPDRFEMNNNLSQAYSLPITFSGNITSVNTIGSNCHMATDYDYYKISLPQGYKYSINPKIYDSYHSDNANTYTIDATLAYSIDGVNWSETYDDVLPNNISIIGGNTIYFKVNPYFTGDIGTYLFAANISRIAVTSTEKIESDLIILYPNPTNGVVNIDLKKFKDKVSKLEIINLEGQNIFTTKGPNQLELVTFNLKDNISGTYIIRVYVGDLVISDKIILIK